MARLYNSNFKLDLVINGLQYVMFHQSKTFDEVKSIVPNLNKLRVTLYTYMIIKTKPYHFSLNVDPVSSIVQTYSNITSDSIFLVKLIKTILRL